MRSRKGFTLTELLVVIAIIALLMGILLPTLHRVRKKARAVVCRAHLRQWTVLLKSYTTDSEGGLHNQGFCEIAAPEFWMHWLSRNASGMEKIRCCPMAAKPAHPSGGFQADRQVIGGTFKAWGRFQPLADSHTRIDKFYHGSYSINSWLATPDLDAHVIIGLRRVDPEQGRSIFWSHENLRGISEVPAFADSWWWCSWPKEADRPPDYEGQTEPFPCGCNHSMRRFCIDRHDGFVNVAFFDGSVRRIGLKQLWTLKWHRQFNTSGPWTSGGGVHPLDWPDWMRRFKDYGPPGPGTGRRHAGSG